MGQVHDLKTQSVEREPENLDDALEIIRSLRAVGDELSDQVEALEDKLSDSFCSRRDRLIDLILPKMIDRFGEDIGKYPENYGYSIISKHTICLANTLLRDLDDTIED